MVSTPKCSPNSVVQAGGRGLQRVLLVDGQVAAHVGGRGDRAFGHGVLLTGVSGRRWRLAGEAAAQGQGDVDQGDEDGDLDQWADDAGEGLPGRCAVGGDRDGDGEFKVVARGGERQRGGALVPQPEQQRPAGSRRPT